MNAVCHPLATPICLNPALPQTSSRAPRTRRRDHKHGPAKKPYYAVRTRCFSSNVVLQVQQQPSVPLVANVNVAACNDDLNDLSSWFPSTSSEYEAYKALYASYYNMYASSNATWPPSKSIPHFPSQRHVMTHSHSSPAITCIIPSLPLNLGLNRKTASTTSSNSSPPPPSFSSLSSSSSSSSSYTVPSTTTATTTVSRKRVSKSDVSEAQWWIKMYESLTWHIQECSLQPSSHEQAFLTRLENKVKRRWYPIVENARERNEESHGHGSLLHPTSGTVSEEAPSRRTTINTIGSVDCCVGPDQHQQWSRQSHHQHRDRHHKLDPTQLVAQAILRRSQANEKPIRRKRQASPHGSSALRQELSLTA